MKSALTILLLWVTVLGGFLAVSSAQENQPTIENFRFGPAKVRYDEEIRYTFSYKHFPGGLAAVKDVEMWVWWQRPGDRAVRSRYAPTPEELAKHTVESGSFESRSLRWRPPERAPYGGVDVQYILKFILPNGRDLKTTAMFRCEE